MQIFPAILEVPVFPICHTITFFLTESLVPVQLPLQQEQQGTNSLQLFLSSASNGLKHFGKIPECVVSRHFRMNMLQLNFQIEASIFNSSSAFRNVSKYLISIMKKKQNNSLAKSRQYYFDFLYFSVLLLEFKKIQPNLPFLLQ